VYGREKGALNPRPIPVRLEAARELARELSFPGKVAVDPAGEKLYISDSDHDRIVVTTLDGRFVRAVAPASGIRFRHPQGLAFYRGDLLVADTENHSIERVDGKTGAVTRIAGTGEQGWTRSGTFPATKVALSSPWDLLVDGDDLYVAMAGPHQIWRMDLEAGTIGAFAGSGREARVDGAFASACFAQPSGLARHGSKIYVAGSESSSIRVLDLGEGVVTTLAGGDRKSESLFHFGDEDGRGFGRRFQHPLGVAFAGGKLYVADTYNHKVKQVDPEDGNVVTIAGTGAPGYRDGPGASAQFYEPGGLAAADGKLYVADTDNHVIRVVDLATRAVSTLALTGVPVPMPPAAAGSTAVDTGPLPDLPGTVDRKVEGKLPAGDATLTIDLSLPEGADLSPGAPAQYRVLTVSGAVRATAPGGRISEEKTGIPLTVNGPGELEVRAVYYWCDPSGTCSIRSVRWRVAVAADPSAPAALVVTDSPGRQRR
jgi:DNA-binding beta-propeller fold protein YncE